MAQKLVSTGQFTIVDNNDAKPITAFITANGVVQQVYNKDDTTVTMLPDWASAPLVLSAKVYVGGTTAPIDVTALLTNIKWSNDLVASIGSGVTYSVNTNLTPAAPAKTYYFEGDYTDAMTGLISHIIAQISISLVQTGSNAVYLQVSGQNILRQATGTTKNLITMTADLIRASGVDNTNVAYQWFEAPFGVANQVDANLASVATEYGFLTTAQSLAAATPFIGAGIPADATWADAKAIVISETAVNNIAFYKVLAKDLDTGSVYQAFFTVYDASDPYSTQIVSSAGDKFQNGVGSTNMTPYVYNGSNRIADLTGWRFDWYYYDGIAPGARAAFINTTKTPLGGGKSITANTTGANFAFTIGAALSLAVGEIVKVVSAAGVAKYYEVNTASSGTTVTCRAVATTNPWLTWAAPASNEFVGGKLYAGLGLKSTNGGALATAAQIVVTGDEVDGKGTVVCEAWRP